MKRTNPVMWIAIALLSFFQIGAASADDTVRGRVVGIDPDTQIIRITIRGREHRVRPLPKAVITRDGIRAEFDSIELKDLVRASGTFDSLNRQNRVMDAHTLVSVGPKGEGKVARFRGRVLSYDVENDEFLLGLGVHKLRIQLVDKVTQFYIGGRRTNSSHLSPGTTVSVLGTVQRAGDGSFDLVMSAMRVDMFKLVPPGPGPLPQ